MPITILLVKKTLFLLVKKTQNFQKNILLHIIFSEGSTNGPKEFRDNI
jgi:hypothetical protein